MNDLLLFADTTKIVLWVVLVGCALGLISLLLHTVIMSRRKNKQEGDVTSNNEPQSDVSPDNGQETANAGETVMSRNVIYSAGADGQLNIGKYIMHSADNSTDKFNVRYNGLVKEYQDGDIVTLADGDTISPVSGSVILSKIED